MEPDHEACAEDVLRREDRGSAEIWPFLDDSGGCQELNYARKHSSIKYIECITNSEYGFREIVF